MKKKRSHGSRGKRKGRVWPGALTASTKRQQYKWRQLLARVDALPLSGGQRQALLDEGYVRIFAKGK
jgi:hypothetical protein